MTLREAFTPFVITAGTCLVSALALCLWPAPPAPSAAPNLRTNETLTVPEPIQPIPHDAATPGGDKVALGKRLFHDPLLSHDNTVSCASCHNLQTAGVDGRPRSIGIHGQEGKRNAPTVFNAALNYRQFWDGRAATLEEQAVGPVCSAKEMGSTWPEVTQKLEKDAGYSAAFRALYPDGIQPQNITDAIAAFERTLLTPGAPFDRYLRGDATALSKEAVHGYQCFKSYGCVSCHQGANVGGNLMQPFGVMIDPVIIREQALLPDRRPVAQEDIVRLTGGAAGADRTQTRYKVPSLRNVARTAPYFHDGSVKSLTEAVRIMGLTQLGRRLPEQDVADVIAFLETLTGKFEDKSL